MKSDFSRLLRSNLDVEFNSDEFKSNTLHTISSGIRISPTSKKSGKPVKSVSTKCNSPEK